jgi:transcriptional regulator with XRE-family HTH domain
MPVILGVRAYNVKAPVPSHSAYYAEMAKPIGKVLADNVKALRKERRFTQPELAQKASLDPQTISRIERNERSTSLETLQGLAAGFKCEPWQLLCPTFDPRALPRLEAPKASKKDKQAVRHAVARLKQEWGSLTPSQRELFAETEEGKELLRHFPSERMDANAWSAADKNASRLRSG